MFYSNIFNWCFIITTVLFGRSIDSAKMYDVKYKTSEKWIVEKSSTLKVSGKSNVNSFSCDINGYYGADTIYVNERSGAGKPVQLNGSLEIDVFKFDCHNKMLTGDLRKTLKASVHPKMAIKFISLDYMPSLSGKEKDIKGWVSVELAGKSKTFQIPFEFIKQNQNSFILIGKKVFCFSDFKLTPPQKLGGMIKVEDEFNVDFKLNMKVCN